MCMHYNQSICDRINMLNGNMQDWESWSCFSKNVSKRECSSLRFHFSQNFWCRIWVGGCWNPTGKCPKPPHSIALGKQTSNKSRKRKPHLSIPSHSLWLNMEDSLIMHFDAKLSSHFNAIAPLLSKIESVRLSVVHCICFTGWLQRDQSLGDPASRTCFLKHHWWNWGKENLCWELSRTTGW